MRNLTAEDIQELKELGMQEFQDGDMAALKTNYILTNLPSAPANINSLPYDEWKKYIEDTKAAIRHLATA